MSKPITINLVRSWDNNDPHPLGIIEYSGYFPGNDVEIQAAIEAEILAEWEKFKETKPDYDGDFIEWLVEKNQLFRIIDSPDMEVVLK